MKYFINYQTGTNSYCFQVRYRGVVVDISEMISAKRCRMPDFPPK